MSPKKSSLTLIFRLATTEPVVPAALTDCTQLLPKPKISRFFILQNRSAHHVWRRWYDPASRFAFAATEVPPVISFALGTLGFLVPFDIKEAEEVMQRVCSGQAKVSRRRRLKCEIYKSNVKPRKISSPSGQPILLSSPFDSTLVSQTYVMNDISIHRGPEPHLTHLDIFFSSLFHAVHLGWRRYSHAHR